MVDRDLHDVPATVLLARFAAVLAELHDRGIVRTRATPAGDLADVVVATAYAGRLAPANGAGWDVWSADGRRLQVKCRVLHPDLRGSESYSPFRSWDFDACVFVLLDPSTYAVRRAVEVPVGSVEAASAHSEWVAGHRVRVDQDLLGLAGAVDVTTRLSTALRELDQLRGAAPAPQQEALPFVATELTIVPQHPQIEPTGSCFCGCGEPTAGGRHFVTAHDRKAEAAIVREHYGSIAAFVAAHRPPPGMAAD